ENAVAKMLPGEPTREALYAACRYGALKQVQYMVGQFGIVARFCQITRFAMTYGINNAASGKGNGRQTVGSRFNGNHAETFRIMGNMANRKHMYIGSFVGRGQQRLV